MEPAEPTRGTKRPLAGDDDDDAGRERKPRFPKGKKAKHRAAGAEGGPSASAAVDIDSMLNPELAAERRARQRHGQLRDGDDAKGGAADIKGFEVHYNDGVNFVDDGIRIEPFNLEREREEGYFDKNGNFVEYARGNEIKVMKILCLVLLMSYDKLLLVTQAPVFCRMPGWIVWKLTQHMLQRYRKKAKRR